MKQQVTPPKIKYEIEAEFDDGTDMSSPTIEREENLNFQEVESYLKKTLFHLRHRALHAEGASDGVEIKITLTAINPTKG